MALICTKDSNSSPRCTGVLINQTGLISTTAYSSRYFRSACASKRSHSSLCKVPSHPPERSSSSGARLKTPQESTKSSVRRTRLLGNRYANIVHATGLSTRSKTPTWRKRIKISWATYLMMLCWRLQFAMLYRKRPIVLSRPQRSSHPLPNRTSSLPLVALLKPMMQRANRP